VLKLSTVANNQANTNIGSNTIRSHILHTSDSADSFLEFFGNEILTRDEESSIKGLLLLLAELVLVSCMNIKVFEERPQISLERWNGIRNYLVLKLSTIANNQANTKVSFCFILNGYGLWDKVLVVHTPTAQRRVGLPFFRYCRHN